MTVYNETVHFATVRCDLCKETAHRTHEIGATALSSTDEARAIGMLPAGWLRIGRGPKLRVICAGCAGEFQSVQAAAAKGSPL